MPAPSMAFQFLALVGNLRRQKAADSRKSAARPTRSSIRTTRPEFAHGEPHKREGGSPQGRQEQKVQQIAIAHHRFPVSLERGWWSNFSS